MARLILAEAGLRDHRGLRPQSRPRRKKHLCDPRHRPRRTSGRRRQGRHRRSRRSAFLRPRPPLHRLLHREGVPQDQVAPRARRRRHLDRRGDGLSRRQRAGADARTRPHREGRTASPCLGTGINPGVMMDLLVVMLTGVMADVEQHPRLPHQQSVAVRRDRDGGTGRRSRRSRSFDGTAAAPAPSPDTSAFRESSRMMADALGWKLQRFEQQMSPIVTEGRPHNPRTDSPRRATSPAST
ncbi:MAG: hypothetical protein MZW92_12670 [Comamonadaceae bacterium]|nr:hypothetical protein [Comamonadaceae bacterium]